MNHELVGSDSSAIDEPQHGSERHNDPAHELDRRRDVAEMNIVRRVVAVCHGRKLELLLTLSFALLVGQLAWPSAVYWWRLPTPGRIGLDQFESATMGKDYLVYLPEGYGGTEAWPLVVFLHGSGERGTDPDRLRKIGPLRLKLPVIIAVPQCLPSCSWEPDAVAELVESVASCYSVDRRRIYLMGFSMGGFSVVQTVAAYPDLFAAVVPISGGGNPADGEKLRSLPVWAFHGAIDKTVPLNQSEQMIDAIDKAGGKAKLTVLPNVGHSICDTVCSRADLWQWLIKQHRSTK